MKAEESVKEDGKMNKYFIYTDKDGNEEGFEIIEKQPCEGVAAYNVSCYSAFTNIKPVCRLKESVQYIVPLGIMNKAQEVTQDEYCESLLRNFISNFALPLAKKTKGHEDEPINLSEFETSLNVSLPKKFNINMLEFLPKLTKSLIEQL